MRGLSRPYTTSVCSMLFGAPMENRLWVWGVKREHAAGSRTSTKCKVKKKKTHFAKSITLPLWVHKFIFFYLEPESCCGMYMLWNSSTLWEHKVFLLPVGFISTESFTWSQQNFQHRQEQCNEPLFMNKGVFHLLRPLVIIQGLTVTCLVEKPVHWK